MKKLYVVYFESANYAGYGEHCLVWANSEDDARYNEQVFAFAEEFYYEQDSNQYHEDNDGEDPDSWSYIGSVTLLDGSEFEEYVAKQPNLYPIVN